MAEDKKIIETTLLRGQLKLLQPAKGFHASTDTVFLAAAAQSAVKERHKVLDIGCGVGSVGLIITLKNKNNSLIGLDIQQDLIDICHQNATLNNLSDRCQFFCGNLKTEKTVPDNYFNLVVMNPPYQEGGRHTPSPRLNKALSHGEEASGTTLEDWLKYSHKKLKQGSELFIIHRADRLDEIIRGLTQRRWFGSLVVWPLHSYEGEPANRVIIRARKERYAPIVIKAGIIMHEKGGRYTKQAADILDGKSVIL